MEVKEGNKLIAVWMGAVDETGYFQASTIGKTKIPTGRLWMADRFPSNMHLCSESDLQYHDSWDWIIPVVEKMGEHGVWTLRPNFAYFECYKKGEPMIFSTSQMNWEREDEEPVEWIFMVHHIVTQFIQFYNQQKE